MTDQEDQFIESLNELQETEHESTEAPAAESASPEPKLIKLVDGDKEYEIPASARYKDKSKDGKELDIALEEMARGGWGQADISKRYTELDHEKRTIEQQKKELEKWGAFRDRLKNKGDKKGYDLVTDLMGEIVSISPDLAPDFKDFEKSYAEKIAIYLRSSSEEQESIRARQREEQLARENSNLKKSQFTELQHYTYDKAAHIAKEYEMFGVNVQQVDQIADYLVKQGHIDPAGDKRSVDMALQAVQQVLEAEYAPKKEKALNDLNAAFSLVQEISPELAKSDEAVVDAHKLLIQKGLPREEVSRRLRTLYADTLPTDSGLEKQRERVTGRKESSKMTQPKAQDRSGLVRDPEEEFLKKIYG